jgi:hypothetical protein
MLPLNEAADKPLAFRVWYVGSVGALPLTVRSDCVTVEKERATDVGCGEMQF